MAPVFVSVKSVKPNKNKFISMNSNLNHFILFPRLLVNIIFFGLTKTGAKTAPMALKLGYFDGRRVKKEFK